MPFWALLLVLCGMAAPACLQADEHPDWTAPIAPFRIADNLYYVGSRDLASYLIATPAGDILINSDLESSSALIRRSVEQLGFRFSDIHILLISHAHFDHDAGSADIERMTGAQYMVTPTYPSSKAVGRRTSSIRRTHIPRRRSIGCCMMATKVQLGGSVLVAHKTPGHTRGCTTWTMRTTQQGKAVNVVIVGSWNVNPGYRLVGRPGRPASYPGIADDYRKTFAVLKGLPCDIFLGAHGLYFDLLAKLERENAGAGQKVWIDPEGYRKAVAEKEREFEAELLRQERTGT